jgi:hypothetical protein
MIEVLQEHHRVCDEIHQCVLDENRFLRQQERVPDAALLERKKRLLEQLDRSLATLRTLPAGSARSPELRRELEQTGARILQILQLDKENEQLLLRCSLAGTRPPGATPMTASGAMLQKIYARCK